MVLTPLLLGAVTTSFISGQIVSRTGRYRPNTLIGPLVLGLGELLLWRMGVNSTNAEAARNMVIAGIGLGMMMQIFVLSVQNTVSRSAMGTATALTQFSRSIGATLGVAVMGVIVNQRLPANIRTEGAVIHRLPQAGRVALANAITPAFLFAAGVCGIVFLISVLWVREVPLRHGFEDVDRGRRGFGATGRSKIRLMSSKDFMPLEGWDHVELWVGNAKQAAYFYEHALGFTPTAYAGPETGVRDRASYVLEQGEIRFVLTSALDGDSEIAEFACRHGDGAKDIALEVPSAGDAYRHAVERGARGVGAAEVGRG